MTWEDWNEDEEKRIIPKIPGSRFLMEKRNARSNKHRKNNTIDKKLYCTVQNLCKLSFFANL